MSASETLLAGTNDQHVIEMGDSAQRSQVVVNHVATVNDNILFNQVSTTPLDASATHDRSGSDSESNSFGPLEEYYGQLGELNRFMSGIVRDGVTFDEILRGRQFLEALRDLIDENDLLGKGLLIDEFMEGLNRLDEFLTKNPIIMEVNGQLIEVNPSEALRVIGEEYARLTDNDGIDYTRLPGVDAEDVEGHETFQQYLAFRQVLTTQIIPTFQALSPMAI